MLRARAVQRSAATRRQPRGRSSGAAARHPALRLQRPTKARGWVRPIQTRSMPREFSRARAACRLAAARRGPQAAAARKRRRTWRVACPRPAGDGLPRRLCLCAVLQRKRPPQGFVKKIELKFERSRVGLVHCLLVGDRADGPTAGVAAHEHNGLLAHAFEIAPARIRRPHEACRQSNSAADSRACDPRSKSSQPAVYGARGAPLDPRSELCR